MQLFRQYFRRLTRRPTGRRDSLLLNIPTKILLEITKHLFLVDQACLALTCKTLHFHLNSVFEHEVLRFPRLYQLRLPALPYKLGTARRQLLQRLEDKRMAYCVKCLKLHPRSEFGVHPQSEPSYFPIEPIIKKYCDRNAGVVDLCPCVSLTIRDKMKLARCLKLSAKGKLAYLGGRLGRQFSIVTHADKPGLCHECEVHDRDRVVAIIKIVLYIGDRKMLVAATEYKVASLSGLNPFKPDVINSDMHDEHYSLLLAIRDGAKVSRNSISQSGSGEHCIIRELGKSNLPVDAHWGIQERLASRSFHKLYNAYTGRDLALKFTHDGGKTVYYCK